MGYKRPIPHGHNYDIEKYKYVYMPLQPYSGTYAIAQDSDATVSEQDFVISAGNGAPSFGEVTDSSIVGLHVDDTADAVGLLWAVPYDCDVESDIEFSVMWCINQATTTDTITWKVLYTRLRPNLTTTEADASTGNAVEVGATALSTAIAADASTEIVCGLQQTSWGILNGGTVSNGDWLSLAVSNAAESGMDASSDAVHGLQLVIRYVRRAL